MTAASRRKGQDGEREVAALWQRYGFTVRGLEGGGDHLVIGGNGFTIHSEVKRRETINVWEHWKQATSECPPGAMPVLHIRRNHMSWLAVTWLDDLAIVTHEAAKALVNQGGPLLSTRVNKPGESG